jgi:uncharacterized membrane protein YdjX (TVP38/TMEM64 family)
MNKKNIQFRFQYPKIFLLVLTMILAYIIFRNPAIQSGISQLGSLKYLGSFIAGILFAFGFTAPFAAGFFITLNPNNILLTGIVGGVGALISDLLIFSFIKVSFEDEFRRLKNTKFIKKFDKTIEQTINKKLKRYILYTIAGIVIASPLPDEIGVIMLAGLTKIKFNVLSVISFILNTIGILILLWI